MITEVQEEKKNYYLDFKRKNLLEHMKEFDLIKDYKEKEELIKKLEQTAKNDADSHNERITSNNKKLTSLRFYKYLAWKQDQ